MLMLAILLGICYYLTNRANVVPWHKWKLMPGEYLLAGLYLAVFVLNVALMTTYFNAQMSAAFLLNIALINDIVFYIWFHDKVAMNQNNG